MVVNNICILHTSVNLSNVITMLPSGERIENKLIYFGTNVIGFIVPYGGSIKFANMLSEYDMLLRPLSASSDVGTLSKGTEKVLTMYTDYVIRAVPHTSG